MIPKVIHYCWFGRNPKSMSVQKCINIWKKYCPEYKFIEWNEEHHRKCVIDKLQEFSTARLVITDRLHGMVFAAITGTACIAFRNYNYKIEGTYEWIEYLQYIQFSRFCRRDGKDITPINILWESVKLIILRSCLILRS